MGLTVHYALKSTTKSEARAFQLVSKMREMARDLPFEEVGDVIDLAGPACDFRTVADDDPNRWLLIQAGLYVHLPWNKQSSIKVRPTRLIAVSLWPGHGCEQMNIGLCQIPETVEIEYRYRDDARFYTEEKRPGFSSRGFDHRKFDRFAERHFRKTGKRIYSNDSEMRTVKTGCKGWFWSSFCKTQYASEPSCGGIPNFLRCHISVVTLLERIAKLPTIKMTSLEDESNYGPSTFSDDYEQALAEGRTATYVWHPGKYNVQALASEVGNWNQMVAAFTGALSDATATQGLSVEAPIKSYSNFEVLEFKGGDNEQLKPFLDAMVGYAKAHVTEE